MREARASVAAAIKQGFRVEAIKAGWRVYGKRRADGFVTIHRTPSDNRSVKNERARLRRLGVDI